MVIFQSYVSLREGTSKWHDIFQCEKTRNIVRKQFIMGLLVATCTKSRTWRLMSWAIYSRFVGNVDPTAAVWCRWASNHCNLTHSSGIGINENGWIDYAIICWAQESTVPTPTNSNYWISLFVKHGYPKKGTFQPSTSDKWTVGLTPGTLAVPELMRQCLGWQLGASDEKRQGTTRRDRLSKGQLWRLAVGLDGSVFYSWSRSFIGSVRKRFKLCRFHDFKAAAVCAAAAQGRRPWLSRQKDPPKGESPLKSRENADFGGQKVSTLERVPTFIMLGSPDLIPPTTNFRSFFRVLNSSPYLLSFLSHLSFSWDHHTNPPKPQLERRSNWIPQLSVADSARHPGGAAWRQSGTWDPGFVAWWLHV